MPKVTIADGKDPAELDRRLEVGRGELGNRLRAVWFPEVCRALGVARLPDGAMGEVHARWLPPNPEYAAALLVVVGAPQWGPYVLQGAIGLIERGGEWPAAYLPFRKGADPDVFAMWVVAVRRIPHTPECLRGCGCKCGSGEPFPLKEVASPEIVGPLLELEALVDSFNAGHPGQLLN